MEVRRLGGKEERDERGGEEVEAVGGAVIVH